MWTVALTLALVGSHVCTSTASGLGAARAGCARPFVRYHAFLAEPVRAVYIDTCRPRRVRLFVDAGISVCWGPGGLVAFETDGMVRVCRRDRRIRTLRRPRVRCIGWLGERLVLRMGGRCWEYDTSRGPLQRTALPQSVSENPSPGTSPTRGGVTGSPPPAPPPASGGGWGVGLMSRDLSRPSSNTHSESVAAVAGVSGGFVALHPQDDRNVLTLWRHPRATKPRQSFRPPPDAALSPPLIICDGRYVVAAQGTRGSGDSALCVVDTRGCVRSLPIGRTVTGVCAGSTRSAVLVSRVVERPAGSETSLLSVNVKTGTTTYLRSLPGEYNLLGASEDGAWFIAEHVINAVGPVPLIAIPKRTGEPVVLEPRAYACSVAR